MGDDDNYVSEGDRLAAQYGVWVYIGGIQIGQTGGDRIFYSVANEEKSDEEYYVINSIGNPPKGVSEETRYGHGSPRWLAIPKQDTIRSFAGPVAIKIEDFSFTTGHVTLQIKTYPAITFRMLELPRALQKTWISSNRRNWQGQSQRLFEGFKPIDLLKMW